MKHRIKKLLPYISLAIIVILYMLPRLQSAQFGLLDDGISLRVGQSFVSNPSAPFTFMGLSGRFFPIFWLYQSFIFQLAKFAPYRWFLANTGLLFILSIMIYRITLKITRDGWAAWFTGLLFIFSGPMVESFYTITKSEPLMILFILAAVMVSFLLAETLRTLPRLAVVLVITFLLFCAYASKETAMVMAGISAGWLVLVLLFRQPSGQTRSLVWFFVASVAAVGVYFLVRQSFQTAQLSEGGYTASYKLEIAVISTQLLKWLGRLLRDDIFIIPLALLMVIPPIRRRIDIKILAYVGVWLAGWFVILLPWRVLESYYTLPFSIGISATGGMMIGALIQAAPEMTGKFQRTFVVFCGAVTLMALVILMINNNSNARLQLAFDRTNAHMVEQLAELPENALALFNVPKPLEYVSETQMHLEYIHRRGDIRVDYYAYPPEFISTGEVVYVVSPVFNNSILPAVRNSLYESGARNWEKCLDGHLIGLPGAELIGTANDELLVFDIGFNRLLPSLGIGDPLTHGTRPLIDSRRTAYGWKIYRLPERSQDFAAPGVYLDGQWTLGWSEENSRQVRFGDSGDIPITGDWNGDGLTDLGVFRPVNDLWLLDIDRDGSAEMEYTLPRPAESALPVTGDWDGNGLDSPGWYNPDAQEWQLYQAFDDPTPNWPVIHFGQPGSQPVAGDWDGDGRDTPGVVLAADRKFLYINQLDGDPANVTSIKLPAGTDWVPAKWFGDTMDTLAVIGEAREWTFLPANQVCNPPNPYFQIEPLHPSGQSLAGVWGH